MDNLGHAIKRIEQFKPNFNYDNAHAYAILVRRFYSTMKSHLEANGLPLETPLVDSIPNERVILPQWVADRLDAAMSKYEDYGITVQNVCRWYIREAYAQQLGLIEPRESLYESLLKVFEMGGYFYEHHGSLVLNDAATIPFVGR